VDYLKPVKLFSTLLDVEALRFKSFLFSVKRQGREGGKERRREGEAVSA
jgi:hypothetical protein